MPRVATPTRLRDPRAAATIAPLRRGVPDAPARTMSQAQDPTSPEAAPQNAEPAAAPPAPPAATAQAAAPHPAPAAEAVRPADADADADGGAGTEASTDSDTNVGADTDGVSTPAAAAPDDGNAPAGDTGAAEPAAPPRATVPEMSLAVCAERLAALFPALFGGEGPPKPVKLRIHADIQQRAPGVFTRKALSIFMHRHTTGNAYLKALLTAPHRHDLDGQPAGEVAEEHRAAAKEELERRRQIALARRAAGRGPGAGRGAPGSGQHGPGDPTGRPLPDPAGPPDAPRAPRAEAAPRRERQGPGRSDQPRTAGAPAARPPRAGGRPQGDRRPDNRPENRPPNRPGRRPEHGPERRAGPRPEQRPDHRPDPGFQGRPADDTRRVQPESGPAGPEDAARRERAALLRTYEASSLSKANFCALKRLGEAELDALLSQARREREARGAAAATPRG